jgi:hypothetical protein
MYYHGEDTKVETNSETSMSLYQDSGTHTKTRKWTHKYPKILNLQHPHLYYPTIGMRCYHVLLQILVNGSVILKKILIFQEPNESGRGETNLFRTTIPTTTNCDNERLLAVHPNVYWPLLSSPLFQIIPKKSWSWCYICHQWKQPLTILWCGVEHRITGEAPVKWYNK